MTAPHDSERPWADAAPAAPPAGQDPAPAETPDGAEAPAPRKKKRVGLWVTLGIVVALLAAAGITIPLVLQQQGEQHELATAQTDFEDASAEATEAAESLAAEIDAARGDADRATTTVGFAFDERFTAPTLVDDLNTALDGFETSVDGAATTAEDYTAPAEDPGDDVDALTTAAQELRDASKRTAQAQTDLSDARALLWQAEVDIAAAVHDDAQAYLDEAAGADEAAADALQTAADALAEDQLDPGTSDLSTLFDDVYDAWDDVEASLVPSWEDISGEWTATDSVYGTLSIDLPDFSSSDSLGDGTLTYQGDVGECFMTSWAPYVETGGRGGAGYGYCPAGVPDPSDWQGMGGADDVSGDTSQDRVYAFGSAGPPYAVFYRG